MKNKNHRVIIEGFWNSGKTRIAKNLKECGFSFINEPSGPENTIKDRDGIKKWYLKNHYIKEIALTKKNKSAVLERSELAAFAYEYITGGEVPRIKEILHLKNMIEKNNILLSYIKIAENNTKLKGKNYSNGINYIIKSENKLTLYNNWYTDIVPHRLGFGVFVINIKNNSQKELKLATKSIITCLNKNRIAQVNVVVCRKNKNGKINVLILKRNCKKGGFWQTITGGVHIGENFYDAAKRELREEIAVMAKKIKYTDYHYSFIGGDGYELHEYVYVAELDIDESEKIKISDEHDEFKWLNPKNAIEKIKFEENKEAIKKSINIIKNGL
jgi:8-oxo-dGTP pyrophosphatase MutT (NUDIX family)